MNVGILTRNPRGWASSQLMQAITGLGHRPYPFRFKDLVAFVGLEEPRVLAKGLNVVTDIDAIIVRPIGRCSLEQAIYRMDVLYALQDYGVRVFNKPSAIEKCIDKYRALYILHLHGLPVPRTIVTENPGTAHKLLAELGAGSVVIKPVFGSRGHGSTMLRIRDSDTLWEVFHALTFTRHVLYVQEYLHHGGRDIRAFVVGGRVVAAMYREAPGSWKTNVSRGAVPRPIEKLDAEMEELAVKSAELLGCEIAGVDLLVAGGKPYVIEVNSQPGWRGIQSVTRKNIAVEIAKYVIESARK